MEPPGGVEIPLFETADSSAFARQSHRGARHHQRIVT